MTPDQDLPTNPGENPTSPASPGSGPRSGSSTSTVKEVAPERIGGYRVVRELGRGGMGVVYLARKDDDRFQRTVAIKVVKRGMDTEDIVRRFETERQLLSAMDHPNIARLLDGGAMEDGRPYFVVEHVEGRAIDKYCDENKLSIGERLQLFLKVCSAVHYAHQNLIVHRDIKPGNIIVTKDGEPKLLDFGIAKLLNPAFAPIVQDPTSPSLRLMTPEYASPEQVRGEIVGTSSDVYSLGVLLFELLTGHRPYRLKTRLQSEIERIICEVEPDKPSTAISRVEDIPDQKGATSVTPASVAGTRERRPDRLRRRLEGDVDNIVLMALRKEPRRRYQSAMQFAEDIRNHLEGRPVIARRPTVIYRAAKFVKRNRYGVGAAAAVFLALVLGVIGTTIGMQRAVAAEKVAIEQRDRAERLFAEGRTLANSFILEFADSIKRLSGSLDAQQLIVSKGLAYLEATSSQAEGDPLFQRELARGYIAIGDLQTGLRGGGGNDQDQALATYRKAQSLINAVFSADPNNAVAKAESGMINLAIADALKRTGDTSGAIQALREGERLVSEAVAAGAPFQRQHAVLLLDLGYELMSSGQSDEAESLFRRSLAYRESRLAAERTQDNLRDVSVAHMRLGDLAFRRADYAGASDAYGTSMTLRAEIKALDPADAPTARSRRDLLVAQQYYARARREMQDNEAAREALGSAIVEAEALALENPNDARAIYTLANVYDELGELAINDERLEIALEWQNRRIKSLEDAAQRMPSDTRIQSMRAGANLSVGVLLFRLDRRAEARAALELAASCAEQNTKRDTANLDDRRQLAHVVWKLGQLSAAEGDLETAKSHIDRAILLMGEPESGSIHANRLEEMKQTRREIDGESQ